MRLGEQWMAFGLMLNEIWKSKMEIPTESHRTRFSESGRCSKESGKRPAVVTVGAWIVIAVSGLMLLAQLLSIPRVLTAPPVLLPLLFLTVYTLVRLALGVAILKGANWARWTYFGLEFLVLNLAVMLLAKSEPSATPAHTIVTSSCSSC